MFRLVPTVKRGSASSIEGAGLAYATIEDARAAASELLRHERVLRVMIVTDARPTTFLEWWDR